MRLIDADKIVYYESVDSDTLAGTGKFYAPRELIDAMPTTEERRRGEWIKISPSNIYECSVCGQYVMTADIDVYRFCHGCGADMRGGQDERPDRETRGD